MKKLVLFPSCIVLLGALATGCGGSDAKKSDGDVAITEFAVNEVIMTADRNYRALLAGDTVYLDQYVSLHWPEKFGNADLTVLRDSLMSYCFGDSSYSGPEEAIRHFITDTTVLTGEPGDESVYDSVEPIDSLPAGVAAMGCYFNNVTATVLDMDEEMVTYQVSCSSYLGGAHPFTATHPFTFDLENERGLTIENMFAPENRDALMPIIINALARQLDVPVDGLERAGIFTAQLTYPGQPYISNNMLYFHYNPYDIAPYAAGMIDVVVYPYEIEALLQPDVRKLFDLGY